MSIAFADEMNSGMNSADRPIRPEFIVVANRTGGVDEFWPVSGDCEMDREGTAASRVEVTPPVLQSIPELCSTPYAIELRLNVFTPMMTFTEPARVYGVTT
jgi:hypothetical protein